MERYEGILRYGLHYAGSRSEGYYASLELDNGDVIFLCRYDVLPRNDTYFESYSGQKVLITGEVSHNWLIVEHLERLDLASRDMAEEKYLRFWTVNRNRNPKRIRKRTTIPDDHEDMPSMWYDTR